jgi:phosphoserine phosphatase RsbU/P
MHVTNSAEAEDMNLPGNSSIPKLDSFGMETGPARREELPELLESPGWPVQRPEIPLSPCAVKPFDRVARLTAMVLGTSLASVTVAARRPASGRSGRDAPGVGDRPSLLEQSLLRSVIESGDRLVVSDTRLDRRQDPSRPVESAGVRAWAGFPVRDPHGNVVGALCVAGQLPRTWSAREIEFLDTLAHVASGEVALQVALQYGEERAELARTLRESLLPARLPEIPGLQVAARYVAGGTGAEVLGDFYDVFPSVRSSWGLVVGDVCGKGAPAAKSTALARYTLRAEAHRHGRPSLILGALNQALLDWLTEDPRFLSAIYATARPTLAGASVQISSAGHPLALVRRASGHVQTLGQPGTLLGLLADPELHDSQMVLRPGDSLIMFTDGVTEARSRIDREIYGDDRLHDVVEGLCDMSAACIADVIQQAVLTFSGGEFSDDTVVLVVKVPGGKAASRRAAPGE